MAILQEPYDNLENSESFKSKVKIIGNTPADGNTKDVKIIIPLKYLSNFLRTLEMPLINMVISLCYYKFYTGRKICNK